MREEKKLLLDDLNDKIDSASSIIVTKYENVTPSEIWNLRDKLGKSSSEMEVVKKRVFVKAFEKSGYKCKIEELDGHIAIVFIKDDPVEAIKALFEFSEDTKKLTVLKGELDKKTYSAEDLLILSKLPSKDDLRAQFLSVLEAPMAGCVSVMNSLLTSVLYAIEEKTKLQEKK
jgi:large subunit ribosomal protein L10